jgi:NAD(P)-dependent dehydrogenase (short-subunit alcohol dehydrogenase family)
VAVVTGAGSSIGVAIANGLAKAGAKVAVIDRDGEAAVSVAARLAAAGGTAIAFTCDVTRQDAVSAVAAEVAARLGASDILVNNAGILRPGPLATVSIEVWNAVLAVNPDRLSDRGAGLRPCHDSCRTPAFDALYAPLRGCVLVPAIEAIWMTLPRPAFNPSSSPWNGDRTA